MTAPVVSLDEYRRNVKPGCRCGSSEGFVCYSHRLVDLMARVEDTSADVEQFRFCDWATFDRLTRDVLGVLQSITDETLPERETR